MDAFSWLVALTLRYTVVLSVALGLGLFLRRSSAVARHRLLTLTAVSLLALPALPWVLPSLELPLVLPGPEPSIPAPLTALVTPAENSGVLEEHSRPTPGPAGAHPAARDTAPKPRGVEYRTAFAVGAVAVWLMGVAAALVGLGRALLRERRLLAASRLLSDRWLETLDDGSARIRPRSARSPARVRRERGAAHRRLAAAGRAPSCARRVLDRGQAPARLAARAGAQRARRRAAPSRMAPRGRGSRSDRPGWSGNRPATRPWFDSGLSRRPTPATWWRSQRRCAAVRRPSRAPSPWSSATSSKGESS